MVKIYGILFHVAVFFSVCSEFSTECFGSIVEYNEHIPTEYVLKYSNSGSFENTFSRYYGSLVPPPIRHAPASNSGDIISLNQDIDEYSLLFTPFCTNKQRDEAVQQTWNEYYKWFHYHVMYDVEQKMSKIGIEELTPEQFYSIRDYLNPNIHHYLDTKIESTKNDSILTRDKSFNIGRNLIKFSLKTKLRQNDISNWTCYSYVAQAKIELDVSIYEHL